MWLAVDVKTNRFVFEGKSSFKMVGLTFSSKLDWGSCIISIAKTDAPSCYLQLLESYKNEYAGLLVLHLLSLFNPWLNIEI